MTKRLPILEQPTFRVKLHSVKNEVICRPFTGGEEKILLLAKNSNDQTTMIDAINQVIHNCTFGKIDGYSLPKFDMEYLMLKLRAKSVGEIITVGRICEHCEQPNENAISLNIDELKLQVPDNFTNKIKLDNNTHILLKYVSMKELLELETIQKNNTNIDDIDSHAIVAKCITHIFDKSGEYNINDYSEQEVIAFVESLSSSQLLKIKEFFSNSPKLQHTSTFICKHCGKENTITIEGLSNFFT